MLTMKVTGVPGVTPRQCARDMLVLSHKLEICVYMKFNGVQMFACPSDHVDTVVRRFERECDLMKQPDKKQGVLCRRGNSNDRN